MIFRKTPNGNNLVAFNYCHMIPSSRDFWSVRAYELSANFSDHDNHIQIEGKFYGDIAYRDAKKSEEKKNHVECYRWVDQLFPELIGKGLKSEGYVKFTVAEVEQSGVLNQ